MGISGKLVVNGVAVAIGADDSLSDIAATVNGVKGRTGVSASVTDSARQLSAGAQRGLGNDHISVVNGDLA